MSQVPAPHLVLASTSSSRRTLLANSGLLFSCEAPGVDEAKVKQAMVASTPKQLAQKLAAEKSVAVSSRNRGPLVIGADQTLELNGRSFDKPDSLQAARAQLLQLRGKKHQLHSALCLSRNGQVIWEHCETASMHMRAFTDLELDTYLVLVGEKPMQSVGGYQIEGPAIQLFERIEGDYFTILGLPLLPLLAALREREVPPA